MQRGAGRMPNIKSFRSVRKWKGPGEWGRLVAFTSIKMGDVFKIYEQGEDEPVKDSEGNEIFLAVSDVYRSPGTELAVDVEGLAKEPDKPITT